MPERINAREMERVNEAGIPQALRLMNSPLTAAARLTGVAAKAGEVTKGSSPEKAIEKLYLTACRAGPATRKPRR